MECYWYGGLGRSRKERVEGRVLEPRFQPGVQKLLELLVDSCLYVSMCVFLGRRFIIFVRFSKGLPLTKSGKNHCSERQVSLQVWITPTGRLCL